MARDGGGRGVGPTRADDGRIGRMTHPRARAWETGIACGPSRKRWAVWACGEMVGEKRPGMLVGPPLGPTTVTSVNGQMRPVRSFRRGTSRSRYAWLLIVLLNPPLE
ncbi:hypothetical protein SEVIR_9G261138v4 [Setaria viridis]